MNVRRMMLLLVFAAATLRMPSLSAQGVELTPYFGGVWPDSSSVGEIKTNAIFGVRTGFHLDPSFSVEGNFAYLNQFEVKGIDPKSRGFLWEVGPTYAFDSKDWPLPANFTPLVAFSVGGITTRLKDPNRFTYTKYENVQFVGLPVQTIARDITLDNGDTFLTMSGGGGVKMAHGPVGFRIDARARILPNYYRSSPVWFEATAGVSFHIGKH